MGQSASVHNQVVEALMDGKAVFANLAQDVGKILELVNANESIDHQNDVARSEVIAMLLDALEDLAAKDYGAAEAKVRAALQKTHHQEYLDLADDKPRSEVKIKLSEIRMKAICNDKIFTDL